MSVTLMGGCRPSNQRDDLFTWVFLIFLLGMLPLWHIFAVWPSFAPKSSNQKKRGTKNLSSFVPKILLQPKKEETDATTWWHCPSFFWLNITLTDQKEMACRYQKGRGWFFFSGPEHKRKNVGTETLAAIYLAITATTWLGLDLRRLQNWMLHWCVPNVVRLKRPNRKLGSNWKGLR